MKINKNTQAEIKDIDNKPSVLFDVNFDDKLKECVRIHIGKEKRIIKYSDLFEFMFILGSPEQQAKMIPVNQDLGYEYMKQLRIKCKKNMKKGEELVVNVKIHVPKVIEESLTGTK